MADVLFVTWDGGGNVPPATAIAAWAAVGKCGYDVGAGRRAAGWFFADTTGRLSGEIADD